MLGALSALHENIVPGQSCRHRYSVLSPTGRIALQVNKRRNALLFISSTFPLAADSEMN